MKSLIAKHPWLVVVFGLIVFLGLSISLFIVAMSNPPMLLEVQR